MECDSVPLVVQLLFGLILLGIGFFGGKAYVRRELKKGKVL